MADMQTSNALAVARLQVARERPYYSSILWAFQPVPTKDFAKMAMGPMGVDQGLRLYYDPETIGEWSPNELATVLMHEIGHVLRNHAVRCGDRSDVVTAEDKDGNVLGAGTLWNMAADLEINDDLQAEYLPFPKGTGIFPKQYKFPDNLMAEEYYELLKQKMPKPSKPMVGQGQCGSVAHGKGQGHEQPSYGNDRVPQGISQAEQELMRQKVAQDVEAHAKTRGSVPAWLERWAKERLRSKVDWRKMLAAYVRRAIGEVKGAVDYSYARPGRRSGALPDFVWPSMRQPQPKIAVVVDTSGSMSEKELGQALVEIEGVLMTGGNRTGVTVMSVDAAVHMTQKVFKAADVKLMGGGGTSMTVGLHAAEALKPRPHVVILVTDCETDWPERPLRMPLIVARTSKGSPAPPWAKVVDVVPDEKL